MSLGRFMRGAPIYRGASNAPTRGTVDPMGYVNRSLGMSPVGADGLSDKRSGLAQAALNRLRMHHAPMQPTPPGLLNQQWQTNPVIGMPRNPVDFGAPPPGGAPMFTNHPIMAQQQPTSPGHIVSPTGQLMPVSPTPDQTTMQHVYGQQQEGAPAEAQLMEAARNRLSHHIQTKEMLTKHQIQMQRLQMQAAEHINQHRSRARA